MAQASDASPVVFRYHFTFPSGVQKTFTVHLDPRTLQLLPPERPSLPEWTRLGCSKCPNCPLTDAQSPQCPAATSLIDIVEHFGRSLSIEQVDVRIEAGERQYLKRCSLQEAVSSLVGLYMATSGCPVMARLRPMVRFHLPFATLEETRYRALSMYLLAQYLIAQHGGTPDWNCRGLVDLYEAVRRVNLAFANRLREAGVEDASLNALIRLDAFADTIAFTVDQKLLEELTPLFQAYLAGETGGASAARGSHP